MFSIRSNRKFTPYCHVSMSSYSRPTLFVSSGIILLSFPYSTSLTWFTIFQSNVETETFWCQPTPDNVQDHEYEVFYDNFIKLHYLATLREYQWTSSIKAGHQAVPYLMFNEISIKKYSIYNAKSNKIRFMIFCIASLLVK